MNLILAERDLYLMQIDAEIKYKKCLLIKKKKYLDNKHKTNEYLTNVKNDYYKYYDYILNEKQQQHKVLSLLNDYINDLIKTNNLVDSEIRTAKYDQRNIMKEIDKIKSELDEMIEKK